MWHEKIKGLKIRTPSQNGNKKKQYKIKEDVASFILMYLTLKEDYAYKMAFQFSKYLTEKNGWKQELVEDFKSLKDQSQLQPILSQMEKDKFLTSRKRKEGGRPRRYFRINPAVLLNPCEHSTQYVSDIYGAINVSEDQIARLLQKLEERFSETHSIKPSSESTLEFKDVIYFIMKNARDVGMHEIANTLFTYWQEIVFVSPNLKEISSLMSARSQIDLELEWNERQLERLKKENDDLDEEKNDDLDEEKYPGRNVQFPIPRQFLGPYRLTKVKHVGKNDK